MLKQSIIISTGFAMFSMFFGSGNLVFPILVGMQSEGHYILAAIGIMLTGVLVPFLGVYAMLLCKGESKLFFGILGKWANFWLPLVILGLMGPFGVLARCITVAHGSFRLLAPVSLASFSLFSCLVIYFLIVNKSRIVPLLGKWLTPFLLLALFVLSFFGAYYGREPGAASLDLSPSFLNGVFQGYQTMDLLASFFFSAFVIKHLANHTTSLTGTFLKAACIGAGLLALVYALLVYLGFLYAPYLNETPPQELLGVIAGIALGNFAFPVVCTAVILACLTTAIVLASLFAEFLETEVFAKKISPKWTIIMTLGIAFSVSTLDFAAIASFLGPILETLYPALIALTVFNIFYRLRSFSHQEIDSASV